MYVTKEYDFHSAIQKSFDENIQIVNVQSLTTSQYVVDITGGRPSRLRTFMCESFAADDGEVWMKIMEVK